MTSIARARAEPSQEIAEILRCHLFSVNKVLDIFCLMAKVGEARWAGFARIRWQRASNVSGKSSQSTPAHVRRLCVGAHQGTPGRPYPTRYATAWDVGPLLRERGGRKKTARATPSLTASQWSGSTETLCALPYCLASCSRLTCGFMSPDGYCVVMDTARAGLLGPLGATDMSAQRPQRCKADS